MIPYDQRLRANRKKVMKQVYLDATPSLALCQTPSGFPEMTSAFFFKNKLFSI